MDQQDGISRRDAVIGVSFLGVLMAALSATIVYRIVDSRPPRGPRKAPLITVAPPAGLDEESQFATYDDEVETVSHETPIAASVGAEVNAGVGASSPTFVAPSSR
ncbi:MAG: hypothetical protein C0485_04055 [Pirellula sp.]|nr:hypothetical protein [Pirellula sp.]